MAMGPGSRPFAMLSRGAPPSEGGEMVGGDGTWEPTVCDVVARGVAPLAPPSKGGDMVDGDRDLGADRLRCCGEGGTPLAPPSEGGEMVGGDGTSEPTVCDVVAGGHPPWPPLLKGGKWGAVMAAGRRWTSYFGFSGTRAVLLGEEARGRRSLWEGMRIVSRVRRRRGWRRRRIEASARVVPRID